MDTEKMKINKLIRYTEKLNKLIEFSSNVNDQAFKIYMSENSNDEIIEPVNAILKETDRLLKLLHA